jgi:putative transcription factor
MLVCVKCAKLGTPYHETKKPKPPVRKPLGVLRTVPPPRRLSGKPTAPKIDESLELVEDYSSKVRQAREKLGLSHEDLGKKIGEKVSVLKKVETGKMVPDNVLARKLEHALQIRLLVPASALEPKISETKVLVPKPSKGLTLGDIAQIKMKNSEGRQEREQS